MPAWFNVKKENNVGEIRIYGVIVSEKWFPEDVTPADLQKEIDALGDVDQLNVYINSPGGNVYDGIAIYQMLKRHKAKVVTQVDGIAASIASVIFQAGDERIMPESTMLFIHNPWTIASGNAADFRKFADDLDKISESILVTYMSRAKVKQTKIQDLVDAESLISPADAVALGLADRVGQSVEVKASYNGALLTVNGVSMKVQKPEGMNFERFGVKPMADNQVAAPSLLDLDFNTPVNPPAPDNQLPPAPPGGDNPVDFSDFDMILAENNISINHFSIERGRE